ncbi:MAG: ribosome assembly RNA-binding protein YhbY [Gammaproteobacteria bacterium]|nr:ribosome assembly RNA-binding protein YhbY [Gammaproteobacteria bacterium]
MALSSAQKKDLKRIAHHLKPVVLVSEQGASDGVVAELQRALNDHELIKIRINVSDREAKQALIAELCQQTGAELVQVIGKMAVLLKRNPEPNRNLSNLLRYKEL